jgi:uncharacterized protein (DUF3084 family)
MQNRMLTLLAMLLLLGAPVFGQAAEGEEPLERAALTTELATLNATLAEIKVLLERITETQGLDLLMKRMELSSTQVVEIEKRLREAESERATVEDENIRLEMNMQAYTVELESGAMEASAEQIEAFTARHEAEVALRESRLRSLDDEIAMLHNRLSTKQRGLEDWQDYVDRRLGGV